MIIIYWILFIILLIFSAFFSSTEVALLASERHKLSSSRLKFLLRQPHKIIISMLIGNEFVNITATVIFTTLFIYYFGLENSYLSVFVMTVILLIFGEITPKTIAYSNPERFSRFVEPVFVRYFKLVTPLISIIGKISNYIVYLLTGYSELEESYKSLEDLIAQIRSSNLSAKQKILFQRALSFYNLKVREIMMPLSQYPVISVKDNKERVYATLKRSNYIGIPVVDRRKRDVIGILNVKKFILTENIEMSIVSPRFIPESYSVFKLLQEIDNFPQRIALVVDEYGSIYGIITKEVLIENLIGSIYKKRRAQEKIKRHKGWIIVDADIKLFELESELQIEFDTKEKGESLNGFILAKLGRFPEKGEKIRINGWTFVIVNISQKKIKKVRLRIR